MKKFRRTIRTEPGSEESIDEASDKLSNLSIANEEPQETERDKDLSHKIFKIKLESTTQGALDKVSLWIKRQLNTIQSTEQELDLPQLAFATTGSDGRFEKGTDLSPTELIIISNGSNEKAKKIQGLFQKAIEEQKEAQSIIFPSIEVKDIANNNARDLLSAYYESKISRVIPTRPLDALLIEGSQQIFNAYKVAFIKEVVFKKFELKKFKNDFVSYSFKTLTKDLKGEPHGTQKNTFVDVKEGIVFYNGVDIKGVKYGAIRSIQYSIALQIIRHLQTLTEEEAYTFLQKLPRSIDDRIQFLSDQKLLSLTAEEAKKLKETYLELLSIYIECQKKHAVEEPGSKTEVRVDKELLKGLLERSLELSQKIASIKR